MSIPDAPLRRDAVDALIHKRGHIDGAALFSTIPPMCSPELVRVLVAYQIMFDFLDSANERSVIAGPTDGCQLHLALLDAVDGDRPLSDYYHYHPWRKDGGYLGALVDACRDGCAALPWYRHARSAIIAEARRFEILALNHEPELAERRLVLIEWARRERGGSMMRAPWYELTAGSSSSLAIYALLALVASGPAPSSALCSAQRAYLDTISVMGTMLDSYVDQPEDGASGDQSYVAHYPNSRLAVKRICCLIRRSFQEALALPGGERHAVIVACMVALYLSKDSARSAELRDGTANLVRAGGSLTRLLVPVLRLWRVAHSQNSS